MLGIKFRKLEPTTYGLHYRDGKLVREGAGLSLLYFGPTSTIVAVPIHTIDLPFALQESTADFQTVTLQGQLSYRVADPKRLAGLLNYAIDDDGGWVSEDPMKLPERLLLELQSVLRGLTQALPLREALASAERVGAAAREAVTRSPVVSAHGLEVLAFALASIRPTPETAKALEAAAREALLREADEAIFSRRKSAVEEERKIKDAELETENAVEEKRRRIRETKMRADIAVEQQRSELIDKRAANDKKDTDSRAYAIERTLAPYKDADWRLLLALSGHGGDARLLTAQALERFAENAGKIHQLSITPELLGALTGYAGK